MKRLFTTLVTVIALCFLARIEAQSADVTNVTITAVIKLSDGSNFTNSISSGNTNIIIAATNAMTKFNLVRASEDPPKSATTNLSQFFIEFTKVQFKQYTNDYDLKLTQDLAVALGTMAETNKNKIRLILSNP